MDSIFHIKINENKLQKILQSLQQALEDQQAAIKTLQSRQKEWQQSHKAQHLELRRFIKNQIDLSYHRVQLQVLSNSDLTEGRLLAKVNELVEPIGGLQAKTEEVAAVLGENRAEMELMQEKLGSVVMGMEDLRGKNEEKKQKLEQIQKKLEQYKYAISLLQNSDFLHFMQLLIDKESENKPPEFSRDMKNPFMNPNIYQRDKRLKELKDSIEQVQGGIRKMGNELGNLKSTTEEEARTSREETHMHYAFLSSKVKDLQQKLVTHFEAIEFKKSLSPTVLYPSKNPRSQTRKNTHRFSDALPQPEDQGQGEGEVRSTEIMGIRRETGVLKTSLDKLSELFQKTNAQFEDGIWSLKSKIQYLQNTLKNVKKEVSDVKARDERISLNADASDPSFIYLELRRMEDKIQNSISKKLDIEIFDGQCESIRQRLNKESSRISDKANRKDTREAFVFIEEKIKEIIMLIADMQNRSKKVVASKRILQCLMCDENFFEEHDQSKKMPIKQATSRASSRIHRRTASNINAKN